MVALQPSMCSRALEVLDSPKLAPAVDLAMVVATAMVVAAAMEEVMVEWAVVPSSGPPLQQPVHQGFKKESSPSSPSESLKFDLNLCPFTVLSKSVKHVH